MTEPPSTAGLAGESGAGLEAVLEELHERSYGWALTCCRWDREEAADVLQSSYLKVLEGRARFGGRSKFSTWLFGVIRRTASEGRRRRVTRRLLLARHAQDLKPEAARGVEPGSIETRHLRAALDALPRRQREVLHLVFYDELSIREAAEVMGVGLGSARVHYDRGKKRLRAILGRAGEEGEEREA